MVLEHFHVGLITLQVHLLEVGALGQRGVAVAHTVTLQVGFGCEVDTILVAKLIPTWVVRIVAGAYGIDVQLLHDLDVLNHALHRHDVAAIRIQLVAVGTLDENGLTVDEQLAALNLYVAETDAQGNNLQHLVALTDGEQCGVERRGLGGPWFGTCDGPFLEVSIVGHHRLSIPVEQLHGDYCLSCRLHVGGEAATFVCNTPVLRDGHVGQMHLRTGIEINLAGNAGEAPEVLVFQIGTVAPAHYLHGDEVLTLLQILRDVELSSHLRVFRVAYVLAVDPYGEVAGGRAYVEVDFQSVPVLRQVEGAAVAARVVVGLADVGWVAVEGCAPRVAHVLIGLVAIAFNLEESRHGEVHPVGVVELQREEVLRCEVVVLHEVEAPLAFHREVAG